MPAKKKAVKRSTAKASSRSSSKKVASRKAAASKMTAPARRSTKQSAAPPSTPSAIGMQNHHFDYTTNNLEAVKRFYVELLGFRNHEHDPKFNYLWVQTSGSSSLGFMPPMPQMGEMSPPKEPTLYFMVDDVDRAYATLSARGVMFDGPPADMQWGHRVVRTTDPEGRSVMLATRKR
jgi:predicted enzyme related to lactoylglutathione lyase